MKEKYDLVLLFSGGLDSAVLLKMALDCKLNPLCLLINYGQQHIKELECAENLCQEMKVNWGQIDFTLPVPSNLTSVKKTYEGVSPWHVPSRNLIFIAFAVSVAESQGIPLVWYGANYEDRELLFPDCYQEWIFELNKLLAINGSAFVKVEAPLLGMQKDTIKKLAQKFGITNEKVFSGYGQ